MGFIYTAAAEGYHQSGVVYFSAVLGCGSFEALVTAGDGCWGVSWFLAYRQRRPPSQWRMGGSRSSRMYFSQTW